MDKLIDKIIEKQNPTCVGLDTRIEYIPQQLLTEFDEDCKTFASAANAIIKYNKLLVDAVAEVVPSVKVQVAYYEMYGVEGMRAFHQTIAYAKQKGLYVIADIKRNDIGATASAYAAAYLGSTPLASATESAFAADSVTVNGYLGTDGILPFTEKCTDGEKSIFVLVKTSNKSSGELQDLRLENGKLVYEQMGDMVNTWGQASVGAHGYSAVGAVVGATYPAQGIALRKRLAHTFFLIPGYGAQGGTAADVCGCFDQKGLGGVVNASRSILCAYKKPEYAGLSATAAAKAEAENMKNDLFAAICAAKGINQMG